jgi:hypothetical protein
MLLTKILDDREFRRDALPLRFQGFHDELSFTRGLSAPHEMEGELDGHSLQTGIYYGQELICC